MTTSYNILFVAFDAYRAGAQMELLHVIRWISENTSHRCSLLLKNGGDILGDYQALCRTSVWAPQPSRRDVLSRAIQLAKRQLGSLSLESSVSAMLDSGPFDLIYLNTVNVLEQLPQLRRIISASAVCHVHELEASIRRYCGLKVFERAVGSVDGFIAASRAVEENLIEQHCISPRRIDRVYEGVYTNELAKRDAVSRSDVRRRLSIAEDAFVVGGCGTLDWRKAPEVFLLVAHAVRARSNRSIHFIWVGGAMGSLEHGQLLHDAERLDVGVHVHFVGPQPNPVQYFSAFDAFFLSSREDPFPLVCLEAAAIGLPVICFERSGGMPEFVEEDAGRIVPYLSVDGVAKIILELDDDRSVCKRLGERARSKIRQRHDMSVTGPAVTAVIEKYAGRRVSGVVSR